MADENKENPHLCNFCNRPESEVKKLIVNNSVGICNECVTMCQDLLLDQPLSTGENKQVDPIEIKTMLDQSVFGQEWAKVVLSVAISNHYKRISEGTDNQMSKSNVLMIGPTGSGKTLLAQTVAKYLDVPFTIADATSVTESGYVGDDVESLVSRLLIAADGDVKKCEQGIIFVDEIDKVARKSESTSITRDVSGEGVQQALLKLVEGTVCRVPPVGGRKHPDGNTVEVDTKNILFIAGGAFIGLADIIRRRQSGTATGFTANITSPTETVDLGKVTPDDLVSFGMIPEFVGRFPSVVPLSELDRDALIAILTEVNGNLVNQYKTLFSQENIELHITKNALEEIADRTLASGTGARGLHSNMEKTLLPHMFEIIRYRNNKIDKITVNKELVENPASLIDKKFYYF